ncbi:MAG: DUF4783 domain-containing protein [Bacteroidetes bacterium]|nr:DUF4783 domain-containing protein [Bacteroidota bacterium]MBS1591201.1 DUF4783 domain-containing protein [Bacteroidota bacterium]MBS1639039.1 DUF4783 domain-containing protein [Bacteroidota bacterium]MBS1641886.1 DUF4783 domain-containing protein [Bacteroidota bacterium]MBS1670669.1 DUF4783 domain-containing protein [Bacteroidota bacterium]
MRKIISLLAIGFTLLTFKANAQSDTNDIINAFKQADITVISNYFENLIDLTLPGKTEIKDISKSQAGIAFKNFYEENGIKGFELASQREAGSIMYMAGKLTGKTKTYNITLLLKNKDGKHVITSIRIN